MSEMTIEQVIADLARSTTVMQEEGKAAMQAAVDLTKDEMARLAPGRLGRRISARVSETASGISGTVQPRDRQIARWVNDGTGTGKVIRNSAGSAYSAATGARLSEQEELSGAHELLTATGYGSKTPGGVMPLHIGGQTIYRRRVRGQAAQHFIERTREAVTEPVIAKLEEAASRVADRTFR